MEALEQRVVGHVLENLEVRGPSLLRTADPPIYSIQGHKVMSLRRVGKRIALGFDNDLWLVFHLMIAGPSALEPEEENCGRSPHPCRF